MEDMKIAVKSDNASAMPEAVEELNAMLTKELDRAFNELFIAVTSLLYGIFWVMFVVDDEHVRTLAKSRGVTEWISVIPFAIAAFSVQFAISLANIFQYFRLKIKNRKKRQDLATIVAVADQFKGYGIINMELLEELNAEHHRDVDQARAFAIKELCLVVFMYVSVWFGRALYLRTNLKNKSKRHELDPRAVENIEAFFMEETVCIVIYLFSYTCLIFSPDTIMPIKIRGAVIFYAVSFLFLMLHIAFWAFSFPLN